jgi:hypothetical protein
MDTYDVSVVLTKHVIRNLQCQYPAPRYKLLINIIKYRILYIALIVIILRGTASCVRVVLPPRAAELKGRKSGQK